MVLDLQITIARTLRNSGYNFEEESERLEWGTARTGEGFGEKSEEEEGQCLSAFFIDAVPFCFLLVLYDGLHRLHLLAHWAHMAAPSMADPPVDPPGSSPG